MLELLLQILLVSAKQVELPKIEPQPQEQNFAYIPQEDLICPSDQDLYWVTAIIDGDTIIVTDDSKNSFQVRLLAVDTPEINGPDSSAQFYAQEATLFTTEFLKNRIVRLRSDQANQDEDPYGRKLRYVDVLQADGTFQNLNEALLENGYAIFPTQFPITNPGYFTQLEQYARQSELGIWSQNESFPPLKV
ncbi:thermonuclease family protein [Patescibacteria group bacterium]|nr:thermonuclease family protein [Patescibacteria group bacterium]